MSKQKKYAKNQQSSKYEKPKDKIQPKRDLLDLLDKFFLKNQITWFWIFFAISLIFTLLLFDLRVSVGGDDSLYIIRADDFIKNFTYPSFQGPLYPMVLSIFVGIFGIKLAVLKVLSSLFLLAHLYFLYRAFRNRIPSTILIVSIILISINSFLLAYGSQTYSEAFFLFAQALFFYYFFQQFISEKEKIETKLGLIKKYFLLGLFILGLGLIKSVGFAAIFAVLIYFAFMKNWKAAGFSTAGFIVSFGLWQLLKLAVWGDSKAQFSDQASSLLQVHPYDASQGMETISGFIQRFFDNSNIYLSRQLFKVLGLRPELVEVNNTIGAPETVVALTILVYALLIIGFIWSLRQNKFLLFTGIYLAVIMGITFIMLQTMWEGTRLIIVFFPFLVLYLITGTYYLFKYKQLKVFQFVFPLVAIILLFSILNKSTEQIKAQQKIFKAQLRGNITAGMTPDWVNFINMSKWAAKNIPADKEIACRKPSISFIYTGRRFQGIYRVETSDSDSLLNYLYDHKIEYVIMASLRKVEARKTDQTINTIQRYLFYIQQKYPEKLKMIHQIGADEPAYLFKIE